jgi:hypothetical protein
MVEHINLTEGLRGLWNAGVALKSGEQVSADLVVDASGRGTHTPQWLRKADVLGLGEPEVISSGITYASRRYKRPADWPEVCRPASLTLSPSLSLCLSYTWPHAYELQTTDVSVIFACTESLVHMCMPATHLSGCGRQRFWVLASQTSFPPDFLSVMAPQAPGGLA